MDGISPLRPPVAAPASPAGRPPSPAASPEPADRVELSASGSVRTPEAALRAPGSLVLPGASLALSAAAAAAPGPVLAAAAGLVLPEAGRSYRVDTEWRGKPHTFEVVFGPLFSAWAQKKGVLVDLEQARALRPDGRSFPLVSPEVAAGYEAESGRAAHPWLQQDPVLGYFGLPTQPVQIDLTREGVVRTGTERPFAPDFDSFRDRPNLERGPTPSELSPLADLSWLEVPREMPGDVLVYARNPDLSDRAARCVDDVLGHRAAGWEPEKARLERERAHLQADPAAPPEEAAAARARQAELDRRLLPVRVFVVPDDRHWLALPFLAGLRDDLAAAPEAGGKATFLGTSMGLMAFVPESDLETGGYGLRHELYHVLEHKYLEPEELRDLDRMHADLVRRGGPFESVYGHQRSEFLTTMAEEFEGEHGADGPRWLQENHPELHRFLRDATGR